MQKVRHHLFVGMLKSMPATFQPYITKGEPEQIVEVTGMQ